MHDLWTRENVNLGRARTTHQRRRPHLHPKQLSRARQVRREQSEPHVIVDIVPRAAHSSLLWLTIENIGATVARDVTIKVDPPLRSTRGPERETVLANAVGRRIPFLAPGRKLGFYTDMAFAVLGSGSQLPTVYTFTVDGKGPSARLRL
ncbi:hypothetical protein ACFXKJ_41040 [Kitasatospora indigofera]|uniref:hypothetical protein n=1 Tax=Kitasatospora TaxID=2063 RepID=UPI003689296B